MRLRRIQVSAETAENTHEGSPIIENALSEAHQLAVLSKIIGTS